MLIFHVLKTGTTKELIFALKSIMKTSKNGAEKRSSVKIFTKLMENLGLNQYKHTQINTENKCYKNATFGTCLQKIKINDNETLKCSGIKISVISVNRILIQIMLQTLQSFNHLIIYSCITRLCMYVR